MVQTKYIDMDRLPRHEKPWWYRYGADLERAADAFLRFEFSSGMAAKLGNAIGYKYSHDDPDGVVPQQYPPDELVGVDYYQPTTHGVEREIATRLDKLRAIIRKKR